MSIWDARLQFHIGLDNQIQRSKLLSTADGMASVVSSVSSVGVVGDLCVLIDPAASREVGCPPPRPRRQRARSNGKTRTEQGERASERVKEEANRLRRG